MKVRTRFIKSVIKTACTDTTQMPWARSAQAPAKHAPHANAMRLRLVKTA